jgi:putative endonuclease
MNSTMVVYIIKCSDNSYYTGVTNNLERRLSEHNEGIDKTCYTFKRRPLELKFYNAFQTPTQAISFEKKIKKWSRIKKEALINEEWDKLKEYSKCKNETSSKNLKKEQ